MKTTNKLKCPTESTPPGGLCAAFVICQDEFFCDRLKNVRLDTVWTFFHRCDGHCFSATTAPPTRAAVDPAARLASARLVSARRAAARRATTGRAAIPRSTARHASTSRDASSTRRPRLPATHARSSGHSAREMGRVRGRVGARFMSECAPLHVEEECAVHPRQLVDDVVRRDGQ